MGRLDFIILLVLEKNQAMDRLSSMTIRDIACAEEFGLKENTIFRKMRNFEQKGYVGRGQKEGRASTYFITPEGRKCLEKERSTP